jgi:hypothetical protein
VRPGDTLLLRWQLRAQPTPMRLGFEVDRRSGPAPDTAKPDTATADTVLAATGQFELVAPVAGASAPPGAPA